MERHFSDDGTKDWKQNWFLDGEKAIIKNTEEGLSFTAGPISKDYAHHAVLWSKKEYTGDLKIEYELT